MKIVTWNVNGLRAAYKKGFENFFDLIDADIFCIQETKMQEDQMEFSLKTKYHSFNSEEKKGYSGTAIFSNIKPDNVYYGIGENRHDMEGRVITLEFNEFYMVNCYTPNSQRGLTRLDYRMEWENSFRKYLQSLDNKKPIILCGDLNVAHKEIDLKNPKNNRQNAGFTDEERTKMTELLASGFIDAFRYLYPTKKDAYTWWSYMANSRQKDIGWRIDYFIVSDRIKENIKEVLIHKDIMGSDHCPVELDIEI